MLRNGWRWLLTGGGRAAVESLDPQARARVSGGRAGRGGADRRSAPEAAAELAARARVVGARGTDVLGRGPRLEVEWVAQRVDDERVLVRLVALRRARAAVAGVAERVLPLARARGDLALAQRGAVGGDRVQRPMDEGVARGVGVLHQQRQLARPLGDAGPLERR